MYVLGMSHAINVLRAASISPLAFTHENWSTLTSAGEFFDVKTKFGMSPGDGLKAMIISRASGWGSVAEIRTLPEGGRQVVAVDGFINLLQSLESVQDNGILFSFLHGNEHSMLSLVQHEIPYDFRLPGHEDLPPVRGAQPIPLESIRKQVERALNPTIAALAMMRLKLPRMRLVHVLSPPPIESAARIMQTPEVFREQLAVCGVSPLSLRLKYYFLTIDVLRQAVAPFDIRLLESPAEARAASGALLDQYAFGATHGDEAYGALVFKQMQALAEG